MGAALTPREVIAALDHWQVPYAEVPGWEKRDNGTQWGDVAGCMFHHTAGDGTDARERQVITYGHSSLPGPLAQFGPRDDGVLDVIAAGPANHAGGGDPDVLAAVRAESYGDYPPKTNEHHGSAGSVIGNRMFYGWETYYAGPGDPTVNPKQYRVAILSMAAITWALDRKDGDAATWTSKSTIGHKEWSDWKPDPAGVDMKDARADIQWCLDNGPDAARRWYDTGERDDMPTPDDFWNYHVPLGYGRDGKALASSSLAAARYHATETHRDTTAILVRLDALTTVVETLASNQGLDPKELAALVDRAVRDRLAKLVVQDTGAEVQQ